MPKTPKPEMLMTTVRARAYVGAGGYGRIDARLDEHRRLYNAALEHRKTAYDSAKARVAKNDQNNELKHIARDDPDGFGAEARRLAVGTLERLDKAFGAFFRRVKAGETPGYPRFKGKGRFRTLEVHSGYERYLKTYDPKTGKGKIKIKGLPIIRFRDKRVPVGADGKPVQPKRILITRTARLLHVSMQFENGEKPALADSQPKKPVGIDVGVNKRAAFSDGRRLAPRRRSRRPKRYARRMARQRSAAVKDGRAAWERKRGGGWRLAWAGGKPSNGYIKERARFATELYRERVSNRQALHREAREIVRGCDFIAVEDLRIQNMVKSARGAVDAPGKGVAQKRGLNRSIHEQSWGELASLIESKAESAGIPFARVDPKNTSRRCSACGAIDKASRRGESFDCASCGYAADADINAAVNILARGLEASGFQSAVSESVSNPPLFTAGDSRRRGALQNRTLKRPTARNPRPQERASQLAFADT